MKQLHKARVDACDHLANAINTFITCDDRKVRRAILFDAVDAIAEYTWLLTDQKLGPPAHTQPQKR